MKKIKKLSIAFVLAFFVALYIPLTVFANSPPPPEYLSVRVSNLPTGAVYADLLIKITENDPNYVDFQPDSFADELSGTEEIISYSTDGYRSFTFHYKNAKSEIELKPGYDQSYYSVQFAKDSGYESYFTQYEDLCKNYSEVKIAILDSEYKIIAVSDKGEIPEDRKYLFFQGKLEYNVTDGSVTAQERINAYYILFYIIFTGAFILFSVGIELIIALLFKFKGRELPTILITNVCTQVAMRMLYVALPFSYLIETIILEALIYIGEFIVYRKRFKQIGTVKILIYTILANTVSLLLGIVLDCIILA